MRGLYASKLNQDGFVFSPRVPEHRLKTEDDTTLRICVAPSVNGCLTARGGLNIGDIVYIHECHSDKVIFPTIEQVPDALLTGEFWITEPVEMELVMAIVITGILHTSICNMPNAVYAFKLYEGEIMQLGEGSAK